MSNSDKSKSFDLMSVEISPIKKPIYTNYGKNESKQSVIKECDNEIVERSDNNKSKKIHVKSRYKAIFSNSAKIICSNSGNNSENSPANKENIAVNPRVTKPISVPSTKTTLGVKNRVVNRIPLKSKVDKPEPKKVGKTVPIERKSTKNKEINNEKPPSGKKETVANYEEMLSEKMKYSKYQNSLDLKYSRYLQSLYLKEYLANVVKTQENNYQEYFRKFDDQKSEMMSTITVLQFYQLLNKRVIDLNYAHEKIYEICRVQLGCLEKLFDKMKLCENLVEVNERFAVEENCLDYISSIPEYLDLENELVGKDVVERFTALDQKLENINNLVQLQSVEMKNLEKIAVSVFEKLVINAQDVNVD